MQSAPALRVLRRLSLPRWLARARVGGAGTGMQADAEGDAAVVALMVGADCAAVRLERRAGSARLHLTRAGSGGPEQLRLWKAAGWFDSAQVVLVLGSEERHFLTLDRPELPPEEMALAARYPLAEALETDAELLLATATPMPLTNDALRPQMLAVAAHLGPVREQLAQLSAAGIRVRHIDIADTALRGMVMLQGQADEGCVALAFVGTDICIGLIWQHQFCALRALALPPRTPRDEAEFEEQLALHIQRTADHFERQATRLAVRSVLASMPSLDDEARRTVLSALPLPARTFELGSALAVDAEAGNACAGSNTLTALVGVAAARLLEPLAEQAAARAQAQETAVREADIAGGYEPLGLTPMAAGGAAGLSPAALSQSAIEQAAQGSRGAIDFADTEQYAPPQGYSGTMELERRP
jgi:hypothetical protein